MVLKTSVQKQSSKQSLHQVSLKTLLSKSQLRNSGQLFPIQISYQISSIKLGHHKKMFLSYHLHREKKKSPVRPVKLFFTLFKLNITFISNVTFTYNYSVNLNLNNTQLYSSTKPL